MSADGHRTKWWRKSSENFNRLSREHERYRQTDRLQTTDRRQTTDRQTDGRRHIANMNLSSRSLKIGKGMGEISESLFRWIIYTPSGYVIFPIRCSVLQPESFECDYGRQLRPHSVLLMTLCTIMGAVMAVMFEWILLTRRRTKSCRNKKLIRRWDSELS